MRRGAIRADSTFGRTPSRSVSQTNNFSQVEVASGTLWRDGRDTGEKFVWQRVG